MRWAITSLVHFVRSRPSKATLALCCSPIQWRNQYRALPVPFTEDPFFQTIARGQFAGRNFPKSAALEYTSPDTVATWACKIPQIRNIETKSGSHPSTSASIIRAHLSSSGSSTVIPSGSSPTEAVRYPGHGKCGCCSSSRGCPCQSRPGHSGTHRVIR
jgi:hypothetical protein